MKVIGVEAANSFVKTKSEGNESAYLNTLRERLEIGEDLYGNAFGNTKKREFYKYNGVIYTKGDVHDAKSSSARDSDRYDSESYKIEMLIAIAEHVENGASVKAVTGLPAKDYKKDEIHGKIVNALKGTHTVYVGNEPRTFEIKDVMVILQPLGTLTFLMLNEDGSPKPQGLKLAKQRKIIVDIGYGTTDVAILEGTTLIDSFGVDVSMFDAYDRILKKLGLENDVDAFEVEKVIREASKNKTEAILEHGGKEYKLDELKNETFKLVTDRIVRGVKRRVSLEKYDASIFTGGGVLALYDHLKANLEDVPNAVPVRAPQMANAVGYYIYGLNKN